VGTVERSALGFRMRMHAVPTATNCRERDARDSRVFVCGARQYARLIVLGAVPEQLTHCPNDLGPRRLPVQSGAIFVIKCWNLEKL
jgi:hypothetical protein